MMTYLTQKRDIETFSVSPENLTGEKGRGGSTPLEEGSAKWAARELGTGWKVNPYLVMGAQSTTVLADIKGEGAIKHIWITDNAKLPRQLILRIYFDGQTSPAVEAPLWDFFANTDLNDYRQLTSLAICCNPRRAMNCYFEMPYFKGFRIELENRGEEEVRVYYQIDCEKKKLSPDTLYFHAQFRRVNPLPFKEDYVILDNVKGSGHYVGTFLHWGVKSNGWWGEGEIKFFIDGDTEYPTVCGTGTEDYFCGSYDFEIDHKYIEFCTPYVGLSKVGKTDECYESQRSFDMYRWHVTDPIYFKNDLRVTIQALGWYKNHAYQPLQDDISSVAYWYSDSLSDVYPPLPEGHALDVV